MGVAKRTVERLESGAVTTQLSGFLRVCRALGLIEGLETLVPEQAASPMAQLKMRGHKRQRASKAKASKAKPKTWTWGRVHVIAKVSLWGRTIGAVTMDTGDRVAAFQYDPTFALSCRPAQ